MAEGKMHTAVDDDNTLRVLVRSLEDEWGRLVENYLPVACDDSIWRYSRGVSSGEPEQGWKLHVSANVLTANEVLKRVAPLLGARGTQFKAPSSLGELQKLNSGLFYGYSQVGKFITVYPRSAEEAVSLARRLHELTRRMSAPSVPFDLQFRPGSCVYYRYGAFKRLEMQNADGTRTPAMRDPEGRLCPDVRESKTARPDWVSDPFNRRRRHARDNTPPESPLATTFRAFQALTQRGKGGVYKAFDLSVSPPRLCILKEGRAGGELAWDSRDGSWRVRHEARVLVALREAGVAVPRVYSSFEVEGHYYLAAELIDGETLQAILFRRRRRLSLAHALLYGVRLSTLLARIHSAGWAWRDCKPANIVVTKEGKLRPLDFEGACPVEQHGASRWSTPGFTPPVPPGEVAGRSSGLHDDLYALGAVVYMLLTGKLPEAHVPVEKLRRHIPARVCEIVADLLNTDPRRRPGASAVETELKETVSALREPHRGWDSRRANRTRLYAGGAAGGSLSRRAKSVNRASDRRPS